MPEHRIRLRAAWNLSTIEEVVDAGRRVDLPIADPRPLGPRFRLVRRFGRPNRNPSDGPMVLELLDVPGLVEARLNGEVLPEPAGDGSVVVDDLLRDRNELSLEVDLGPVGAGGFERPWGAIALVIGPGPSSPH